MTNQLDLLSELKLLFSEKGLQDFIDSFMNISDEERIIFNLKYNEDEFRWEGEFEDEVTSFTETITRSLYSKFEKAFASKAEFILKTFDNMKLVYEDEPDVLQQLLKKTAQELKEIRTNLFINAFVSRYLNQIQASIFNLEGEVISRLNSIQKGKSSKSEVDSQKKVTNFKFRYKGKENYLKEFLRNCGTKDDLLIYPNDLQSFIEFLTLNDSQRIEKKIQFECNTKEAVYILNKLIPFFKGLNPQAFEKANLFLTKEGVPLTANNMYNAKNAYERGKTFVQDKEYIDYCFEALENRLKKELNKN